MAELKIETIIECVTIYMGDYPAEKQYAAAILLKMILKEKKYKELMEIIREELGFQINDRNDKSVVAWKKKVKSIGKCEVCGSPNKLEAHHVIPWKYSITGRTDVNNGMCLCKSCHRMMHNDAEWIDYMRRKFYGHE